MGLGGAVPIGADLRHDTAALRTAPLEFLFVVRCSVLGLWCLVFDFWFLVIGIRY